MTRIILYLAILCICTSLTYFSANSALGQKRPDCTPNTTCFLPGDYLKYNETLGNKPFLYLNFTYQVSFGKGSIMIDEWQDDPNKAQYTCSVPVWTCGNPSHFLFQSFLTQGIWADTYQVMEPTPINSSHFSGWSLANNTFYYNGNIRHVLVASHANTQYIIDRQTGIVLRYQTGSPQLLPTIQTLTLLDSNIIPSNLTQTLPRAVNKTAPSPPPIKNPSISISNVTSYLTPVPLSNNPVSNQNRSSCTPALACFFPGDYLKYNQTVGGKPFLYSNFAYQTRIDRNSIMVDEWDYSAKKGQECNPGSTCGVPAHLLLQAFLTGGIIADRYEIVDPIPIDINRWIQGNWSLANSTYDYNGNIRDVLVASLDNTTYVMDKQTGIVLSYQTGNPKNQDTIQVVTLVSTNIFSSPNIGTFTSPVTNGTQNSTQPVKSNIIYKDDAHNFSFYPPAEWTQSTPTLNQLAYFTKFTSETSATFGIYFTNTGKPIPDSTLNSTDSDVLDTFVKSALLSNPNQQYNITQKSIEKFPFGYKIKVTLQNIPPGNTRFEEAYYWLKDGNIYNFLLVSDAIGFTQNLVEFDTAFDSLYVGSSGSLMKPVPQQLVPSWIKNNAKWWANGQITDIDFIHGMQYLIQKEVMKIPHPLQSSNDKTIPPWIRTSAGLWGTNQISDTQFVEDIKYLIQNGIIIVS